MDFGGILRSAAFGFVRLSVCRVVRDVCRLRSREVLCGFGCVDLR